MTASQFLAVFFGRAAHVVRERYGETAYIDASGSESILIADRTGILGAGFTLGDALKAADETVKQRQATAA